MFSKLFLFTKAALRTGFALPRKAFLFAITAFSFVTAYCGKAAIFSLRALFFKAAESLRAAPAFAQTAAHKAFPVFMAAARFTKRLAFPSKKRLLRLSLICALLFAFGFFAVRADGVRDRVFPADVALVLGAKVYVDNVCSKRLQARLQRAVELYRQGMCKVIIVSGGVEKNGIDEAKAMRMYLLKQNIPDAAIVVDPSGANTRASAVFTAEYMRENKLTKALAVTQFFHITRSRLALQQEGVPTVGSAHARYFSKLDFRSTCREVAGLPAYFFRFR